MQIKFSVLIHGPFSGNCIDKIFEQFLLLSDQERENYEIIIVSYVSDYEDTIKLLEGLSVSKYVKEVVAVRDLLNPGFFNINRQIVTVKAGLEAIQDGNYVIKLRNDQSISFKKLNRKLLKYNVLSNISSKKILTTNCFTRKDRLYHPSDMFLCGYKEEINTYYNCKLMNMTHISYQFSLMKKCEDKNYNFISGFMCPEKILFMNYLRQKGWDIKNTFEDSYNAINEYCLILNSWDIDYCWNKKRNPVLKTGSVILPYYFTMEPFRGAPIEKARCYMRHNFIGTITLKDLYYIGIAKTLYFVEYNCKDKVVLNLRKVANIFRNHYKLLFLLQHSPFWPIAVKLSSKYGI